MFLHLSVSQSVHRGESGLGGCLQLGTPALGGACSGGSGRGVPAPGGGVVHGGDPPPQRRLLLLIFTTRKRSLRSLCFYTCLSVNLFTGGSLVLGGTCSGGCLFRGVWSGGCLLLGGGGAWRRPPPETATAAGGTHPTGMHSCLIGKSYLAIIASSDLKKYPNVVL